MKFLLLAFTFFVGTRCAQGSNCPPSVHPCTCEDGVDGICSITCDGVSLAVLEQIGDIRDDCGGGIHFSLLHAKLLRIPFKLWMKLLSSSNVDVSLKDCVLTLLTEVSRDGRASNSHPPEGIIRVHDCVISYWNWGDLSRKYPSVEGIKFEMVNNVIVNRS